jgi:hypothetical protein
MIEILRAFETAKPKKSVFGNFRIEGDLLLYQSTASENLPARWTDATSLKEARKEIGAKIRELDGKLIEAESGREVLLETLTIDCRPGDYRIQGFEHNLIAVKVEHNGQKVMLGNSDLLDLVGRRVAYGNDQRNERETEIQVYMRNSGYLMLPMNQLFSRLNREISGISILEIGPSMQFESTARVGVGWRGGKEFKTQTDCRAVLFQAKGKTYLADVDRRESRHGRYFAFLNEVSGCESIADAYESMIPAEAKGKDAKRIGSLFLVPSETPRMPELTLEERLIILAEKTYGLSKQDVNYVVGPYVSGSVSPDSEKLSTDLLKKVPRRGDVGGYSVETVLVIDGETFCKGKVEGKDRAGMQLSSWFRAYIGGGKKVGKGQNHE